MKERRTYRYQIQSYAGTATITCDEDTENEVAEAIVERQVSRGVSFGMGYRQFDLLSREPLDP